VKFLILAKKLMPSWVTQSELTSYLEDMENNSAPPELLALKQPNGHVPYVDHINVADVLLAGPHTATLEDGFVSRLQHDSVRHFLDVQAGQFCFGAGKRTTKAKWCPKCVGN
jgi:hypothetical protein